MIMPFVPRCGISECAALPRSVEEEVSIVEGDEEAKKLRVEDRVKRW